MCGSFLIRLRTETGKTFPETKLRVEISASRPEGWLYRHTDGTGPNGVRAAARLINTQNWGPVVVGFRSNESTGGPWGPPDAR